MRTSKSPFAVRPTLANKNHRCRQMHGHHPYCRGMRIVLEPFGGNEGTFLYFAKGVSVKRSALHIRPRLSPFPARKACAFHFSKEVLEPTYGKHTAVSERQYWVPVHPPTLSACPSIKTQFEQPSCGWRSHAHWHRSVSLATVLAPRVCCFWWFATIIRATSQNGSQSPSIRSSQKVPAKLVLGHGSIGFLLNGKSIS